MCIVWHCIHVHVLHVWAVYGCAILWFQPCIHVGHPSLSEGTVIKASAIWSALWARQNSLVKGNSHLVEICIESLLSHCTVNCFCITFIIMTSLLFAYLATVISYLTICYTITGHDINKWCWQCTKCTNIILCCGQERVRLLAKHSGWASLQEYSLLLYP